MPSPEPVKILVVLNDPPYGTERAYNGLRLAYALARRGAEVSLCGTCMEARSVAEESLVPGAHRSTLEELADWTLWAERVLAF